jgi:hypothetical protein
MSRSAAREARAGAAALTLGRPSSAAAQGLAVPRWKLCYRRMQDPRNFAMVWVQELLQEQKAVFGPDPWPYNLEDNRKALEAVVRYEFEQGMIR